MILLTHHSGESHGILGVQAAGTHLTEYLGLPTLVVGMERQFSRELLFKFLDDHYKGREKIIGFSHLCGRKDLLELIGALKERGFFTILGGPQAERDYYGETDSEQYQWRFKGLHEVVDLAIQGPVHLLTREDLYSQAACLNFPWEKDILLPVDWTNMYTFAETLKRLSIKTGQVLNSIGCPHAKKKSRVCLPPPGTIEDKSLTLDIESSGCIFCDVARDKGFTGYLDRPMVIAQIERLPEAEGRKIPFELIDEYPLNSLPWIMADAGRAGIKLSRIDLVCRADDINAHAELLCDILQTAREQRIAIRFSSIGFESFSDRILGFFNKGITVADIVRCVGILRQLKRQFGATLLYRRDEGANHGFIHPTPWDDTETVAENNRNIAIYGFFDDILPPHSVPLIIHHASYLGDWIRQIETRLEVGYQREGTWIEWWSPPKIRA